jgi:hypothetical protein
MPAKDASDLRPRLELARLDSLALFRALDRMDLSASEIPQGLLRELFELDGDCAEALLVLDQPPPAFDVNAMRRDTLRSLDRLPKAREKFCQSIAERGRSRLAQLIPVVRQSLSSLEAYNGIPGRDPTIPRQRRGYR